MAKVGKCRIEGLKVKCPGDVNLRFVLYTLGVVHPMQPQLMETPSSPPPRKPLAEAELYQSSISLRRKILKRSLLKCKHLSDCSQIHYHGNGGRIGF